MIIDQLTASGVIEPGALYEAPFMNPHTGGSEGLFAGNEALMVGVFQAIDATQPLYMSSAGQ